MVGFYFSLALLLLSICVDEVPARPPFPPNHRQAGEWGAINYELCDCIFDVFFLDTGCRPKF